MAEIVFSIELKGKGVPVAGQSDTAKRQLEVQHRRDRTHGPQPRIRR